MDNKIKDTTENPNQESDDRKPSSTDQINSPEFSSELKADSNQPPSRIPPTGGGDPPEEPDEGDETWTDWFYENNPLYLLSVLFMFGGLLMASQASHEGATLGTVAGFFGVQNIYEIIMIAMAIYLLRNKVNLRHGKILLVFGLVFLADVTFYQARITAMASVQKAMWVPLTISGIYLVLAGLKLYGVLLMLNITLRWEQFFYSLAAFGMVYFSPQYFMSRVYDLENLKMLQNESFPQRILFQIFLVAALIQIPAIVGSW